ncbi:MAG: regulator of ime2, partial [Thelocarpon superellum]
MLRPATPLSVVLFLAFVLLLLSVLSTPIITGIKLASGGGVDYGVFGFCEGTKCSAPTIGYNVGSATNADFTLGQTTRHSLSPLLIVHPIAALFTLIMLFLALAAHLHSPSHSQRYLLALLILSVPTLVLSLLAFLVDLLMFLPHLNWPGWIVLAATLLLAGSSVITCAMRRTLVSRKARKKRIAENAEMSGENYYNREGISSPPLSREPSAPVVNGASGADKLPGFATFDSARKEDALFSNDDRIPLNSRSPPSGDRHGSGSAQGGLASSDDGSERYGGPPRGAPGTGSNRGRGYTGPRDEYGNPLPPSGAFGLPSGPRPGPAGYVNDAPGRGGPGFGARGRGGFPPSGRGGYGAGPPPGAWPGPAPPPGYARGGGPGPDPMGRGYPRGHPPAYGGAPGGRGAPYGRDPSPYRGGYGRGPSPGPPSGPGGYGRRPSPGPPGLGPAPGYGRRPSPGPPGEFGGYSPYGPRQPSPGPPRPFHPHEDVVGVGQAIEMDATTGSPSPSHDLSPTHPPAGFPAFRNGEGNPSGGTGRTPPRNPPPTRYNPGLVSPTSIYSAQEPFVPARAVWADAGRPGALNTVHEPDTGSELSPAELPAVLQSPRGPTHGRNGSGDHYYEDADPRFTDPMPPHAVSEMPPASSSAYPPPLTPQRHDPRFLAPLRTEHEEWDDLDDARSPAASDASHYTSVSQRGVNPNWHPMPGPGADITPRRPVPNARQDLLLTDNSDFALPSAGRGR